MSLTASQAIAPQAARTTTAVSTIPLHTFASTTASIPNSKILFLGYHGNAVGIKSNTSTSSDHDSDSKDKDSSDKRNTESKSETNTHEDNNKSDKGKKFWRQP